jgi:hypothetical protein
MLAFLRMNEPTTGQIFEALIDLRDAVAAGFAKMVTRDEMNARFDGVGARFDAVDARFDRLERRVTNLETRVDEGFTRIDERLGKLESRRRR